MTRSHVPNKTLGYGYMPGAKATSINRSLCRGLLFKVLWYMSFISTLYTRYMQNIQTVMDHALNKTHLI